MGTTGDAPVGPVAGVGSTAGHVLRKVPEPVATDSAGQTGAKEATKNAGKQRNKPPEPLSEAKGAGHTIIERPGREGQYTTYNAD